MNLDLALPKRCSGQPGGGVGGVGDQQVSRCRLMSHKCERWKHTGRPSTVQGGLLEEVWALASGRIERVARRARPQGSPLLPGEESLPVLGRPHKLPPGSPKELQGQCRRDFMRVGVVGGGRGGEAGVHGWDIMR